MVEKIIEGVIVTPLKQINHPKGDLFHAMKNGDEGFVDFGEAYFSTIKYNAIKAWKRHKRMTLNLVIPHGEVKFVLWDGRKSSKTYNNFFEIVLSQNNYKRLTIPAGIWMGFQGLSKEVNLLLNIADIKHDPDEQENVPMDELQINYNW